MKTYPLLRPHMSTGVGYWERHARRYDRATRFFSRPVPRMLELAVDAARGKARALEVAAGTGLLTTAIGPVVGTLVATDYSDAMVRIVEERVHAAGLVNVTCTQADLAQLPFDDGDHDLVVAANVLHLVSDLALALASLRRVLRPGGMLIAPTYLHGQTFTASVLSRLLALTGFPARRRFTARSLHDAITGAGFRVTREEVIRGPFPIGFVQAVR